MLLAIAVAVISQTAAAAEPCDRLTDGETQVVQKTNEARKQAGLHALVIDCRLMTSARRHARRMAREQSLSHSDDEVAENVAAGPPTAEDAVAAWMESPPHRGNVLNREHRRIGVAGFVGKDGRAYWVQQFSAP